MTDSVPASSPLYRNGQLIGGPGVSGDGVDHVGFDAPFGIPRNPEQSEPDGSVRGC
jgi:hypothetical protein